jgi:uncharacterized damage-inducible protein DinB
MTPLEEAFKHHLWATEKLIEHLRGLPDDALGAGGEGVYGEVLATLSHMLAADGRYLTYLEGNSPPPSEDVPRPLDELADELRDHAVRWRVVLDVLATLDVTLAKRGERPEMPHATNLLIAQALHHGTDHRTQICTVLSANGFESPVLDVWQYWRERRLAGDPAETAR